MGNKQSKQIARCVPEHPCLDGTGLSVLEMLQIASSLGASLLRIACFMGSQFSIVVEMWFVLVNFT